MKKNPDPLRPIDANTAVYGIFGNPVGHSLSPFLHNAMFSTFGLNAVYLAFPVAPHTLGIALEGVRSLKIRGINLTIPFKEEAMNFIDEVPEDMDRCVGAINTVVNRDGKLFGYNTDGRGFLTAIHHELAFNPEGKKVLVLGAGGAARGVGSALAGAHAEKLWFHNRTRSRAEGLVSYLAVHFPETEIQVLDSFEELKGGKVDLIVNATSCGMHKQDPSVFDFRFLKTPVAVYDLIYSPAETAFLSQARKLGFSAAGGLGMLAAQAALSFELWTGHQAGVREKMLELLKTCSH